MKKIIVSILIIGMLLTTLPMGIFGQEAVIEEQDNKMMIISSEKFASTLQRLIDFKNEHGFEALLKDVDDIYNKYSGRDEPEQIKYFIKDTIETLGISYFLLVGNEKHIPVRIIANEASYSSDSVTYFPTDLYYADVYSSSGSFCSWDSNNNNLFGEYESDNNIDELDLIEDVYIDRIPCDNDEELNKIIDDIVCQESIVYNNVRNVGQNSVITKVSNDLTINSSLNFRQFVKISSSNEYDMVIISRNFYRSAIQTLINHKNSHGVKTFFKDVNEIYNGYPGRDHAEKIKYFIKDAIETKGISYVLMVGHFTQVPMREVTYYGWGMDYTYTLLSDLYYADIYNDTGDFCSWDSNNNNLFGEYMENSDGPWGSYDYIDELDLYADVHIGRIPCRFNHDLETIVNKIINYENSAYGTDWFKRVLLLGGDTHPGNNAFEGEVVTNLVGNEMAKHGFENIKLWASQNNFRPFKINNKINDGAGFISFSGHGATFGLQVFKNWGYILYLNFHLLGLHNQEKLPIVFFDACSTSQPMYIFDSFAYNIVKKANGGAITSIGATEIARSYFDDAGGIHGGPQYLNLHFFMNYEEGITVGEMLTKAEYDLLNYDLLNDEIKDPHTLALYVLIGDPSLKVGGYGQNQQGNQQSSQSSQTQPSTQQSTTTGSTTTSK